MKRAIMIVMLLLLAPPAGAVELLKQLPSGQLTIGGSEGRVLGVVLDVPTSFHVLQVLEDYPMLKEENGLLLRQVERFEALDEIRKEREKLYQDRIAFLESHSEAWGKLQAATLEAAKQAREARGSWWDRFVADMGKYTVGAVVGAGLLAILL